MGISQDYINHIQKSLDCAIAGESKLPTSVLEIVGMSGKSTRHFLNNLGEMSDVRYLEIGTSTGSTLSSMMCGNQISGAAIDNWSREYSNIDGWCPSDTPREEFLHNFTEFKRTNDVQFIDGDCWGIDVNTLGKFNVYMYDANHSEESHYKALNYYASCLDDVFIYLIDDWNWDNVRAGTLKGIAENEFEILYHKEIFTMSGDEHPPWDEPPYAGRKSYWHNGLSIFVLDKK